MSALTDFYLGKTPDHAGRFISDIWNFTDEQFEGTHDFIQWLFPNREPSRFNPQAPVLTDKDVELLRDEDLQERVFKSIDFVKKFYGLRWVDVNSENYVAPQWMTPNNHNYLRLTRILKFCVAVEADWDAYVIFKDLQKRVERNPELVSEQTLTFWKEAAGVKE